MFSAAALVLVVWDFFFLNCASSFLCWRLNSKMFAALSHQLHTSLLCVLPAALTEGGRGVKGWLWGWMCVVCLCTCGFSCAINVIYRIQFLKDIFGLQRYTRNCGWCFILYWSASFVCDGVEISATVCVLSSVLVSAVSWGKQSQCLLSVLPSSPSLRLFLPIPAASPHSKGWTREAVAEIERGTGEWW